MRHDLTIQPKDMRRTDWYRITARRYAFGEASFADCSGATGLIALDQVSQPFVRSGVTLADIGYTWVQFAPAGANWWLTAMFDPDHTFVQGYIDITLANHIRPNGASWFEDLFLDIVVLKNGQLLVLDGDELDAALTQGLITPKQHRLAIQTAHDLLELLQKDPDLLPDFCRQVQRDLLAKLPPLGDEFQKS